MGEKGELNPLSPWYALSLPSYLTSLAQKMPGASFEDLFPLAEDAAEVFAQCCDSLAEDCVQKKVGHPKTTSWGFRGSEPPPLSGSRGGGSNPTHPPLPLFAVIGAHGQSLRRALGPGRKVRRLLQGEKPRGEPFLPLGFTPGAPPKTAGGAEADGGAAVRRGGGSARQEVSGTRGGVGCSPSPSPRYPGWVMTGISGVGGGCPLLPRGCRRDAQSSPRPALSGVTKYHFSRRERWLQVWPRGR